MQYSTRISIDAAAGLGSFLIDGPAGSGSLNSKHFEMELDI